MDVDAGAGAQQHPHDLRVTRHGRVVYRHVAVLRAGRTRRLSRSLRLSALHYSRGKQRLLYEYVDSRSYEFSVAKAYSVKDCTRRVKGLPIINKIGDKIAARD